jgi:hypothetical protein
LKFYTLDTGLQSAVTSAIFLPMSDTATKPKRRPRDANQLAKVIVDIATAVETEDPTIPHQPVGRQGGKARADGLSADRRTHIAKKAAQARWKR